MGDCSTLEHVARTLCNCGQGGPWEDQGPETQKSYLEDARMALGALYAIDAEAIAVGILAGPAVRVDNADGAWSMRHTLTSDVVVNIWQGMLSQVISSGLSAAADHQPVPGEYGLIPTTSVDANRIQHARNAGEI